MNFPKAWAKCRCERNLVTLNTKRSEYLTVDLFQVPLSAIPTNSLLLLHCKVHLIVSTLSSFKNKQQLILLLSQWYAEWRVLFANRVPIGCPVEQYFIFPYYLQDLSFAVNWISWLALLLLSLFEPGLILPDHQSYLVDPHLYGLLIIMPQVEGPLCRYNWEAVAVILHWYIMSLHYFGVICSYDNILYVTASNIPRLFSWLWWISPYYLCLIIIQLDQASVGLSHPPVFNKGSPFRFEDFSARWFTGQVVAQVIYSFEKLLLQINLRLKLLLR